MVEEAAEPGGCQEGPYTCFKDDQAVQILSTNKTDDGITSRAKDVMAFDPDFLRRMVFFQASDE